MILAVSVIGVLLAVLLMAVVGQLNLLTKQLAAFVPIVTELLQALRALVIVENNQATATIKLADRQPTTVLLTVNELAVAAVLDEADIKTRTKH